MTLTKLKKIIQPIETYLKELSDCEDGLKSLCADSYFTISLGNKLLDSYVSLATEYYNDKPEWISYYVWDCEMGKKPTRISFYNKKGEEESIVLDSLEKLHYIMSGGSQE